MATKPYAQLSAGHGCRRFFWENMGNDDDGDPIITHDQADGTIQAIGTFGGATVNVQGSNDGGTTWANLTDETGTEIALTAAGMKVVLPRSHMIRPLTSGGSGSDIDVYMHFGGGRG